ncbi:family 10 glycosylhydrolase [Cohnella kolymensis]|uniref:family 10 glycosylhydrolase n=1 Tax=Cohnella kolymensis TaxID=1590652 RepID=UPI000695C1D9|nr:family 10 glycosylhydrolase [Cohnella kolymensis]
MTRNYDKASRFIRMLMAFILISGSVAFGFGSALTSVHAETAAVENVEAFESLTNIAPASARANSVKLDLISRPESIPYGYRAAKLTYDFTGTIGTSAAYINFKDPSGTAGRTLQGSPKKLGLWVYGDAGNHWLRGQVQDASGARTAIDFTTSTGLNWNGWKYVTANLPAAIAGPVKLNQIYVTETKDNNKNSGSLYFDQLKAFYTDTSVFGLDLVGLPPMQIGDAKQAKVYATYQGSQAPVEITSGVSFASSNNQVASVDSSGTVRALEAGTAVITATFSNAPQASYTLTVSTEAPAPQRLELQALSKLENGSKDRLKVFAAYNGMGDPVTIISGAVFQSSSPDIASIDAAGQITTLKVGSTTITASYGGSSASYTLTVTEPVPVLQKIELPGLKAMIIGQTQQAKVMGTYTWIPEPVEITSGVTYTSSNPLVATVSSTGLINAIKFGTTRITAVYSGKTTDFYLVVNKEPIVPKRELRAAWIASVDNVDWPEKGVVTAEEQKRDFIAKLNELQAAGMNAAIVQIKPTADAFYPSQYGPWSEWLTGEQGKDPGYNPLEFMLEEVHKRNMEFHAWFNPYRISLHDDINKLVPDHPARLHPDWVVSYGGRLYFNPGIPEAQNFIREGIMEVVRNYDIDAVHFDDYFYPYPVAGVDFPDEATYRTYGSGFANKADWRRDNVNSFIRSVNEAIKQEKSYVKFGISPFGIWRNKAQDPTGSDTNGLSSYDAIYADSKKWIQQGWIDYITPQIYWYMGYTPAAYDKLIEWWSQVTQGTNVQLYSGKATYRIGSSESWLNPDEMPNQIAYDRNFDQVDGSIFFSTKSILSNLLGFTDRLKNDLYRYPALIPAMPHLDSVAPEPAVMKTAVRKPEGVRLTWRMPPAMPHIMRSTGLMPVHP